MHEPRDRKWAELELDRDLDLETPRPAILGRTVTNVAVIAGLWLIVAWLFGAFGPDTMTRVGQAPADGPEIGARPPSATGEVYPEARAVTPAESRLTVPPDARGHFMLMAAVDGIETRFLVDTGASVVVLSREAADDAGLQPDMLDYTVRLSTANGEITAAPVVLREVAVGDLRVADVEAVVVRSPLDVSLLGASFLSRLEGYEVSPAGLTLRW